MSENDALVVDTPDGSIDPRDHDTLAGFKAAVYEYGTGTWFDDVRLAILYHRRREEELPDHLQDIADIVEDG